MFESYDFASEWLAVFNDSGSNPIISASTVERNPIALFRDSVFDEAKPKVAVMLRCYLM